MEPSAEDRIRRMAADGVLSDAQAGLLRDSLAGAPAVAAAVAGHHRALRWALWGLIAAIAVGALVALAGGGGPQTVQDVAQTLNQPGGHGEMNRTFSSVVAIAVLLIVPLAIFVYLHNSLVAKEERVSGAWAQTESNFQRRADLIPALVETVSRYLKHERETLGTLARERAGAATRFAGAVDELIKAQKDAAELLRGAEKPVIEDEAALARLFETQASIKRLMGDVFAVAEAYPELRSSDQFLQLQAQIEGTENRINVARLRFNDAVRDYNASLRMLPWNIVAGLGNFQRKAYFRSREEARDAPDLQFK